MVLTEAGAIAVERLVAARRAGSPNSLPGWVPEQHEQVRRLRDRLAGALVTEMPATAPVE